MFGLIRLLLLGLLIATSLAVVAIVRQLRQPPRRTYAFALRRNQPGDSSELPPPLGPRAYRAFTFAAPTDRQGRRTTQLPAWEIPGDDPLGPTIICTPGWGDSKLGILSRLAPLLPHASRVIAWDPAGMGESPASSRCNLGTDADVLALLALVDTMATTDPSLHSKTRSDSASSTSLDAEVAAATRPWRDESANPRVDFASQTPSPNVAESPRRPPGPQALLLLGWSLGAGVSIVAASRLTQQGIRPVGVIAEAPYRLGRTPVVNYLRAVGLPYRIVEPIAAAWLGWKLRGTTNWSSFDRAKHASNLPCPLLVIHGTLDAICPHEDGQRIAAAARRSLFVSIEGAGHNDLWEIERYRTQCERAVSDFLGAIRDMTATGSTLAGTPAIREQPPIEKP